MLLMYYIVKVDDFYKRQHGYALVVVVRDCEGVKMGSVFCHSQ